MAYAPNQYNYQVLVIFGIVMAAMLLLAAVIGGIYFICVINMRKKKGSSDYYTKNRYGIGSGAWPPPQPVAQPPYTSIQNPPLQIQNEEYPPRSQPSPYSAAAAYSGNPPQQYLPQQQYPPQQQFSNEPVFRDIRPEYTLQQGPITYTTLRPQEERIINTTRPGVAGYHMSSV